MLFIEVNRISGHQTPHETGKVPGLAVEKEVEMIRHEGPRQASGVEAFQIP